MATVERKIHFFRLDVLPLEDGSRPNLSIGDVFREIQKLKFRKKSTGPTSRYSATSRGIVCPWIDSPSRKHRLLMGKVRRTNLPSVDSAGKRGPLPISPDDGIVDISHLQFFANNIVGAEFNFYAPRASAVPLYCEEKCSNLPRFRLRPLLKRDVLKHIQELDEIKMLSVKVKPSQAGLLEAAGDNIVDAISSTASEHDAGSIEIILRASRGGGLRSAKRTIRSIFSKSRNPSADFERFHVAGHSEVTDQTEEFDLLKDQYVFTSEVEKVSERSRSISSSSMFKAIERAYNRHKAELIKAPALGLDQ